MSIVRVSRWRADDRDGDDDTADTAHLLLSRCHNSQQCDVSRVTSDHYEYCPIQGPHAAQRTVLGAAKLWLLIRPHVTSAAMGGGGGWWVKQNYLKALPVISKVTYKYIEC